MNDSSTFSNNRVLPPWLWFWLAVYLLNLPKLAADLKTRLAPALTPQVMEAEQLLGASSILLRFATVMEVVPFLIVFLGILAILAPKARARYLQRSYQISDPPPVPAIEEIRTFLAEHAPHLRVRANLRRTDQLAFVYPLGYTTYAIALFGGIVKLWRADKEAAQAVLLHEVAHYRQGDTLIIGAGSFFEVYLRRWLLLLLLFVGLPILLNWGYSGIRNFLELRELQALGVSFTPLQLLQHEIGRTLIYLPGALLIAAAVLLWTIYVVLAPLLAIWCAELYADHFAVEVQQKPDAVARAMHTSSRRDSGLRWLLFWMTHPPLTLRRWMVRHSNNGIALVFLLALFPLAYIVRLLALLGWASLNYLGIGTPIAELLPALTQNATSYLVGIVPLWFTMAGVVLLWPLVAGYWERLFTRSRSRLTFHAYPGYLAAAIFIGGLALSGYSARTTPPSPLVTEVQQQWEKGALVEVEWQGQWWDAVILESTDGRFYIQYEGYDSSWDEWVDASRIRGRSD